MMIKGVSAGRSHVLGLPVLWRDLHPLLLSSVRLPTDYGSKRQLLSPLPLAMNGDCAIARHAGHAGGRAGAVIGGDDVAQFDVRRRVHQCELACAVHMTMNVQTIVVGELLVYQSEEWLEAVFLPKRCF